MRVLHEAAGVKGTALGSPELPLQLGPALRGLTSGSGGIRCANRLPRTNMF